MALDHAAFNNNPAIETRELPLAHAVCKCGAEIAGAEGFVRTMGGAASIGSRGLCANGHRLNALNEAGRQMLF